MANVENVLTEARAAARARADDTGAIGDEQRDENEPPYGAKKWAINER